MHITKKTGNDGGGDLACIVSEGVSFADDGTGARCDMRVYSRSMGKTGGKTPIGGMDGESVAAANVAQCRIVPTLVRNFTSRCVFGRQQRGRLGGV